MKMQLLMVIFLPAFLNCEQQPKHEAVASLANSLITPPSHEQTQVKDNEAPKGFSRKRAAVSSFESWLRSLPLRNDKTVYLYNHLPKRNQQAQFAVLDMPIGNQDLQQCADVVMRLRAEYLYRYQ